MDGQPALAAPPGAVHGERIDQAVFASLRSHLARGYRIVAASGGLAEDEKREIVQRAPSHGNLSDPSEHAQAQAGFVLRSGRYCLLFARHAGPEPSGRGGYRVHTHAFVLAPPLYRRLRCDPFAVGTLAGPVLESAARTVTSPVLQPIAVPAGWNATGAHARAAVPTAESVPGILQVVAAVLTARRTIVTGAPAPRNVLQAVFAAAPLGVRQGLSFAHGMKFSTQRGFQLLFHGADACGLERIVRDQAYTILEWGAQTALPPTAFAPWLNFVRNHWETGRGQGMRALTDELDCECSPDALARVAALATDVAVVESVDVDALQALRAKWRGQKPAGRVQRKLLARLERAAAERLAALAAPETAGEDHPSDSLMPPAADARTGPHRGPPGL